MHPDITILTYSNLQEFQKKYWNPKKSNEHLKEFQENLQTNTEMSKRIQMKSFGEENCIELHSVLQKLLIFVKFSEFFHLFLNDRNV